MRYTAEGWLDKNRGFLSPELALVLSQSKSAIVRAMFPPSAEVKKKSTISSTFRKSLRALSTTMLQTAQTYVRCVKPNGVRQPNNFEGHFVLRQLRYTGVASVVEVQRSGYPISVSHADFISRYRCIALDRPDILAAAKGNAAEGCKALLKVGPSLAKATDADWVSDHSAVVGKTRIFMKDVVVRTLEGPRQEAIKRASLIMQRVARAMIARVVLKVLMMHTPAAAAVRAALAKYDAVSANDKLESLAAKWEAMKLPLKSLPLISECRAELDEFRGEVQTLEEGLELESEALVELQALLNKMSDGSVDPKEGYVNLKVGIDSAKAASKGYKKELTEAIAKAGKTLTACLGSLGVTDDAAADAVAGTVSVKSSKKQTAEQGSQEASSTLLAALEADVEKQKAEKETERKGRQAAIEKELIASATNSSPSVVILKLKLSNDVDAESSEAKQLLGYSEKSTGVVFSEGNAVAVLRRGGRAQRDGQLKLGDVVVGVNGSPLNGERIVSAMDAAPKAVYELTVARSTEEAGGKGDFSGWVHAVRAREGKATFGEWERRMWVVLDGLTLTFRDSKIGRVHKERTISLKGATCKTPVTRLKGQTLKQPPVISTLLEKQRFPFVLFWPQGEVAHDVVLACATSADRTGWCKAINSKLAELKAQAPTEGYL